MRPGDKQILFQVAQWYIENKYKRLEQIRQLVVSEEMYLVLRKEIDRVDAQLRRARTLHAEATLTLVDWLMTLDDFDWQCAYCLAKPFQVMSHFVLLPTGGTTPDNCIPACSGCGRSQRSRSRRKGHDRVQEYLRYLPDTRSSTSVLLSHRHLSHDQLGSI
jgi:hypothetical protein